MARPADPHRGEGGDPTTRALLLVVAGAAVLAAGVRAVILAHSGGLSGLLGYDQGVYFSAAEALAWGRLPYRDFLFLHPPGVIVALAPLGALARLTHDSWGIELARVAAILLGAVNAGLVALAARRAGLAAAATAAAFYAVWRPVAVTETETRLEPFVSLGLLVALAVLATPPGRVRRRALVSAGCALGFALTVKIWAVVPVLVISVWFVARFGRRAAVWVLGPLVATGVVVCLPFLLAAPSSMVRMVVVDQLSRGRMPATLAERATGMLGLSSVVGHRPHLRDLCCSWSPPGSPSSSSRGSGCRRRGSRSCCCSRRAAWCSRARRTSATTTPTPPRRSRCASERPRRPSSASSRGPRGPAPPSYVAPRPSRWRSACSLALGHRRGKRHACGRRRARSRPRRCAGSSATPAASPPTRWARWSSSTSSGGTCAAAARWSSTSAGCPTTGTRPRSSTAGRHRDAPTCAGSATCAATSVRGCAGAGPSALRRVRPGHDPRPAPPPAAARLRGLRGLRPVSRTDLPRRARLV